MIENLVITWWNLIGETLEATYTRTWTNQEWDSEFQRYLDWNAIEWANSRTYQVLNLEHMLLLFFR